MKLLSNAAQLQQLFTELEEQGLNLAEIELSKKYTYFSDEGMEHTEESGIYSVEVSTSQYNVVELILS